MEATRYLGRWSEASSSNAETPRSQIDPQRVDTRLALFTQGMIVAEASAPPRAKGCLRAQALVDRPEHGFGAAANAQLSIDVGQMCLHRPRAYIKMARDLSIARGTGEEPQHLDLPGRQRLDERLHAGLGHGRFPRRHIHQALGDLGL